MPDEAPFTTNYGLRKWSMLEYSKDREWYNPSKDWPDFRIWHLDSTSHRHLVYVSLYVAPYFADRTKGLKFSRMLRNKMITAIKCGDKAGFVFAIKDTHRLYAARVRASLFFGEFDIAKSIANGSAIELQRSDPKTLTAAIEFFARDDGERESSLPTWNTELRPDQKVANLGYSFRAKPKSD